MSQRYTDRADVFSFAIVMWECLTRRLPYASNNMTAMAAGFQVATQGLRPEIPFGTDHATSTLMRECWAAVPDQRPSFPTIVDRLEGIIQTLDHPFVPMVPRTSASSASSEVTCHIMTLPKQTPGLPMGLPSPQSFPKQFQKIPPPPPLHFAPPMMQKQVVATRPMQLNMGSLWGGRGTRQQKDSLLPI